MTRPPLFVAGFIGGVLPHLLGMAREAVGSHATAGLLWQNPGYWLGTALFGVVGAVLVYFFGESDRRKALIMGASAPGIVLGFAQGGSVADQNVAMNSVGLRNLGVSEWLISAAHAEIAPQDTGRAKQSDTLWVRVLGLESADRLQTELVAFCAPRARTSGSAERLTFHLSSTAPIAAVPGTTDSLYLVAGGVPTEGIAVPPDVRDTLTLRFTLRTQRVFSGFARALGIRSVTPWKPKVLIVTRKSPDR